MERTDHHTYHSQPIGPMSAGAEFVPVNWSQFVAELFRANDLIERRRAARQAQPGDIANQTARSLDLGRDRG